MMAVREKVQAITTLCSKIVGKGHLLLKREGVYEKQMKLMIT